MQAEINVLGETHGNLISEIQQRLDFIKDDKMNSSKISGHFSRIPLEAQVLFTVQCPTVKMHEKDAQVIFN